jgi:hypothetical protein
MQDIKGTESRAGGANRTDSEFEFDFTNDYALTISTSLYYFIMSEQLVLSSAMTFVFPQMLDVFWE